MELLCGLRCARYPGGMKFALPLGIAAMIAYVLGWTYEGHLLMALAGASLVITVCRLGHAAAKHGGP